MSAASSQDEARRPTGIVSGGEGSRAVIFGCSGSVLTPDERRFFADCDPVGFILFRRNCESPAQIRDLVLALRESIDNPTAPVLIDQEGGRVARLRPPHWRTYPTAQRIAALADPLAEEAARLGARLIADDLSRLGITVDCLPVLDVPAEGADPIIGDRAYGTDPARVARLGRAVCEGLLAGGVAPVIKHVPGHGRAEIDSHLACPRVDAPRETLSQSDFMPFRALASMPWAMTAHIVYGAIDAAAPATFSETIVTQIIRREIGFEGVLVSDDLSMQALGGSMGERARRALAAGCDLVLHCNGDCAEMADVASATGRLTSAAIGRLSRAEAMRRESAEQGRRIPFDRAAAEARFDSLVDRR